MEINGNQEGALHLFAETVDSEVPTGDNVILYEDGLHEIGTVELQDGQTVYLCPGAVVRGQFVANHAENIAILGHGIIDGSAFHRWKEQQTVPIDISNCKNVQIADITILDPAAWTLNLYHCEDVQVGPGEDHRRSFQFRWRHPAKLPKRGGTELFRARVG